MAEIDHVYSAVKYRMGIFPVDQGLSLMMTSADPQQQDD
jgi:hypothetical protein